MLPENDADARQQVMLHGLFHRIQPELGLITEDGINEHLHTLEGRIWLQLEWRALRRAVESSGSDRAEAIADALAFRRERRLRFPGAAENERRDEIREGLASYTGIAAWANSPADAHRAAALALAGGEMQTSFVGNFEAASGPAYGVLLDDLMPGWRRQVRSSSDLGDMLASAIRSNADYGRGRGCGRYDGATLRAAEEARDRALQARVAELRRRFVDGPVLTMPAAGSGPATPGITWHSGRRYRVLSRFHSFGSMGSSRTPTTASCALRWDDPLRTGDPAARRDPSAGRRLEHHAERGMGRATSGAGWLIHHRAREMILAARCLTGFALAEPIR
jgi:hypothetical protein